jgi:hypothetical protein
LATSSQRENAIEWQLALDQLCVAERVRTPLEKEKGSPEVASAVRLPKGGPETGRSSAAGGCATATEQD